MPAKKADIKKNVADHSLRNSLAALIVEEQG